MDDASGAWEIRVEDGRFDDAPISLGFVCGTLADAVATAASFPGEIVVRGTRQPPRRGLLAPAKGREAFVTVFGPSGDEVGPEELQRSLNGVATVLPPGDGYGCSARVVFGELNWRREAV